MPKFTAYVLTRPSMFHAKDEAGNYTNEVVAVAHSIRLFKIDGQDPVNPESGETVKPVCKLVRNPEQYANLVARGFGKGSVIELEADLPLEWDPAVDNVLPGTDKFPEAPVHRLPGVVDGSIIVKKKARAMALSAPANIAPKAKTQETELEPTF